jgi:ribokinase
MVDVARLAHVSVGTVSNVLNDTVVVRPETREKVEAAIRTLSFQPNTLARSLISSTRPAPAQSQDPDLPQLILVGAASVDYTAMLSVLPHRNDRITARSIEKSLGGPAANTAVFAAALEDRFPVAAELVTTLGDDADSDWALAELALKNVSTIAIRRQRNQRISRCIVLVEQNGSRTILNEPVVLLESDLTPYTNHLTQERRCLHVGGSQIDTVLKTTGLPKASQTAANVADLIGHFDLVFLNRDVIQEATRCRAGLGPVVEATLALVRSVSPKGVMILTLGEDGALVIFPDAQEPVHVPGLAAHVVDTTGAGDAFAGAFLAVWLNTHDAIAAARYGNAAGAVAVSVEGSQTSVPTATLLERLLEVAVRAPQTLQGVVRLGHADKAQA